ncbi:hypothetical protein [Xenorhabdus bovienii]|uniref:hypothetical protein n=2 Tax=Xenorhabdus bovienii TaxID=40576 RepID=UPI00237C7B4A|nr:hypothetical protein [Xenorhabdus bovienii]MDE1484658.1 hypothetical protein [Xenorhabdus bovienii]MDE9443816.1 hypothetical protein [Xenorhabdus bovienii]
MNDLEYWTECISSAADDCDLVLTQEQVKSLAESVSRGHECYGMSFYSPPDADHYAEIERKWSEKYAALQRDFDSYRGNAETAVRTALGQYSDDQVSIGEHGEVFRIDGRTTRIQ